MNENGDLHRDGDLPAMESVNGDKHWYVNGKLHRDGGLPAIVWADGDKHWYVNGKLHRADDMPSVEYKNGNKMWCRHGILHRDNGRPALEHSNGDKYWYVNGKLHRDHRLPAFEDYNGGNRAWYVDGLLHRDGGRPAIDFVHGDKFWHEIMLKPVLDKGGFEPIKERKAWYINGVNITFFRNKYQEVHKIRAQKKIYFWIIQRLYRPGSASAKRLAEKSWQHITNDFTTCRFSKNFFFKKVITTM